ncbi:MAG: master DNA invertase Mpi family serine-type recombinase [Alphaproteobacteria bacterium]|jgi:DNA invertase Pin-like site-specific DNA recombinase|nr:master DNA invertase Mpi family serine-type recombinase [Alphaproteobacteria bacterium]
MIYAYIRVSTDKQTTENQRWEIQQFCQRENIIVDKWVEETISATKELKKRKLGKLLKQLNTGDIIIASEISRLGRKLFEIMSILNYCMNNEANVWTIKDNFRLDAGIQSKVLAFAFGLSAEIERNLISQRTKEALASRREAGIVLGRPKGRKNSKLKLSGKEVIIEKLLNLGHSQRYIAKKLHVHRTTLGKFIKLYKN